MIYKEVCPECDGEGMFKYPYPNKKDPESEMEWDTCRLCDGKKIIDREPTRDELKQEEREQEYRMDMVDPKKEFYEK